MEIEDLIEEFSASNFHELELRSGDRSVRLMRKSTQTTQRQQTVEEIPEPEKAASSSEVQSTEDTRHVISAQRVGFFFPEVKPGDRISSGDLVGQVKAMNINHEIRSAVDGEVESICVDSGAGVAFGDPLVKLVEE